MRFLSGKGVEGAVDLPEALAVCSEVFWVGKCSPQGGSLR